MPLLFLAGVLLLVPVVIALTPLLILQRYRVGTSRRQARGWLAGINVTGFALSAVLYLAGAAITSTWAPHAFTYAAAGLGAGCCLGALGLALSRWEDGVGRLHYTPNRWLVLGITAVVAARFLYSWWRAWHAWQSGLDHASIAAAAGVSGSLAAGAIVLGYYLAFWAGIRQRLRQHRLKARLRGARL